MASEALCDTHCHLDFNLFDEDRGDVLARAWEAGLERVLNPGIDLASSQAAASLAQSQTRVFAAVGVHPNEATNWGAGSLDALRRLAENPKVVAIGEIGLDYYRDRTPREVQRRVFGEQLRLAAELGLPVIIHNREATDDILPMLTEWRAGLIASASPLAERPGVLHSYSGPAGPAQEAIALNFFIGFTGPLTFRNAPDLRLTAAVLPLDHLLIETDSPFLTPHPHRGKRNEPAYVRLVAEKLAEIHSLPLEQAAATTTANARRLFNW